MALTSQGKRFIAIVIVLSSLATAFGLTRIFVRRKGPLGTDDRILCVALVFIWAQATGACLLASKGGMGRPMGTLSPDEITWLLKMFYWPELGYTLLVVFVKTSILLSYRRIFGHVKSTRWHIYVLMGLVWSWGIAIFLTCVFQCTPIRKAWEPAVHGKCIQLVPFLWGNSVSNLIIDWMILAVPIVPVWKLHMDPAQKTLVAGSFALGSIACTASTVRAATTGSLDANDLSKSVFLSSVWTYIEPSVAIVSACLPFLSTILRARILRAISSISTMGTGLLSLTQRRKRSGRDERSSTGKSDNRNPHSISKQTTTTISRAKAPGPWSDYEMSNNGTIVSPWDREGSSRSLV
ncbi:hypothetical protein PG984_012250 [Apiospora sp. TS-2023a]